MKTGVLVKSLAVVTASALVLVSGPVNGQVTIKLVPMTEQQATLPTGEALYGELCVACHGPGGLGDGPAISALADRPSNLTVLAVRNHGVFPREEVKVAIAGRFREDAHASIGMPSLYRAFAGVHPKQRLYRRQIFAMKQIDKLTDYLESIQITEPEQVGHLDTLKPVIKAP